ncbi:MAG: MurR/RpiR family transcriptional regulator [Hespellia sp.]|nr:MurR/RpiR family transcriptional regulator [Hespellia sp.]
MPVIQSRLTAILNKESPDSVDYYISSNMLDHLMELSSMSISEIAEMCAVSKSTISKFVRELGFDDYADFKIDAKLIHEKDQYTKEKGITINITDFMLQNGVEAYQKALFQDIHNLFEEIDYEKVRNVASMIHDYKRVAAFGDAYSETAALNLQHKMKYYRKTIYTTTHDRKQTDYIEKADTDTLIIIFSNRGRYISNYQMLDGYPEKECFEHTKAKIILITSNEEMAKDSRIDEAITYRHSTIIQNHPVLFQMILEIIAIEYQKQYGFPSDKQ